MKCIIRWGSNDRSRAIISLYIGALFLCTCIRCGVALLVCRQAGKFRVCEIPEDIPPPPLERGEETDVNFSSPSASPTEHIDPDVFEDNVFVEHQSSSTFSATVLGSPSSEQRNALDFCMKAAGQNWISDIGVTVRVNFSELGDPSILGTAQPTRNWIVNSYICPVALAEAIVQEELNAGHSGNAKYDILMTLNSATNWYLGTDGSPSSGEYDLVTVCLHEIYHGLFMSGGNIGISTNKVDLSYSAYFVREAVSGRFDAFMANQDGCNITAYRDNPNHLGSVLTGNNLWFVSESERIARLFAPRPYTPGSSLYHLSEADYGAYGDKNDLMTPAIGSRYAQHDIGPLMLRIQDIILDIEGKRGADACEVINPPVVEDNPITQDPGTGLDPSRGDSGSDGGFKIRLGNATLSGWVIVGVGVGAVLLVILTFFIARAVLSSKGKKATRQRPKRRLVEPVVFAEGGNEGSIV